MALKIGLTGGIGCGKSTVVAFFREAGFETLESDQIVRNLLAGDRTIIEQIVDRWGAAICDDDGKLSRKAIAGRVFADANELDWLESLLHPKVRDTWQTALNRATGSMFLVEIPLLFEKRLETQFDITVCVEVSDELANQRMSTRGYTVDEVVKRRSRQLPLNQKIDRADLVISNSGSLNFLKNQTFRFIEQLKLGRA